MARSTSRLRRSVNHAIPSTAASTKASSSSVACRSRKGDKTRLLVTEAIFGNPDNEWEPPVQFQNTDVFPGGSPNSVFVAGNPVALDSVLYDYIGAEDQHNGSWHGPDTWLHIAANDFGMGIHEHGTLATGTYSNLDFEYQELDYLNRSI